MTMQIGFVRQTEASVTKQPIELLHREYAEKITISISESMRVFDNVCVR